MGMQGTSVGSIHHGMKNTSDPSAKEPINESAGLVASDSLAAESNQAGGGFSENRNSEPISVKGSNSTLNNTDTSGATTLPAAASAANRESEADGVPSGPGGGKYAEALGGQPSSSEVHTTNGYTGGASSVKSGVDESNPDGHPDDSADTAPHIDAAPSYIQNVVAEKGGRPKGKNLKEEDFDDASANTGGENPEVGSENDPGRAAIQEIQKRNSAASSGGQQQGNLSGDGQYNVLGDSTEV